MRHRPILTAGLAFLLCFGFEAPASARFKRDHRRVSHAHVHRFVQNSTSNVIGADGFGVALGLVGTGIAGATTAGYGYGGYSARASGYGGYGNGYYGPGYGYVGY